MQKLTTCHGTKMAMAILAICVGLLERYFTPAHPGAGVSGSFVRHFAK
jgi:hypothetical protein